MVFKLGMSSGVFESKTVGVKLHASTVRNRLHQHNLHGKYARKKPLLFKKKITARLQIVIENTGKDDAFLNNVQWTDESKLQ